VSKVESIYTDFSEKILDLNGTSDRR